MVKKRKKSHTNSKQLPGKYQHIFLTEQPQEDAQRQDGRKTERTYLLVTRWRSFISALSNQTWGHDLTMALWTIPIKPPWTWPTWPTFKLKCCLGCKINTLMQKYFRERLHLYHCISSVIAEDQNVDRRGVIGHTNSSFLRLVFPVSVREMAMLSEAVHDLSPHTTIYLRVVIADGGREPPSTDPEAHHMHPFAEPGLCPKPEPHINTNELTQMWRNRKNDGKLLYGHLEFGRNPTAVVPTTSQVRPMQASNILPRGKCSNLNTTCWWDWIEVNIHIFKLKGVTVATSWSKYFQ